ncbi:MAG TPA: hypothetical protein VJ917_02150 [Saprospiraceae bacterium]|nr:hypothetical protein [Saprospiraceae bacterium]
MGVFFMVQCTHQNPDNFTGYYEGVFILTEKGSKKEGLASLRLRDSTYQSVGQQSPVPAGGSGTWEVQDTALVFRDKNIWTADFDWHLILDGRYRYELNRDSLILQTIKPNGNTYTYRLKRMKP